MDHSPTASSSTLSDLPVDELAVYASELGLLVELSTPRGELLRRIRRRQELLLELDRAALLDLVVWARRPVRRSTSKEALAKEIAGITRVRFDGLSDRGLRALARLRDVQAFDNDPRQVVERRLRRQEGFWSRVRRKRRAVVGSLISKALEGAKVQGDYHFLPEDDAGASLKETIKDVGVVGGIAQKLRGAADVYIEQKLDEIERRIDAKLDDIDGRMAEWRDEEVKNRLRIVRITLVTAIVVAVLSLGYNYVKIQSETGGGVPAGGESSMTQPPAP